MAAGERELRTVAGGKRQVASGAWRLHWIVVLTDAVAVTVVVVVATVYCHFTCCCCFCWCSFRCLSLVFHN